MERQLIQKTNELFQVSLDMRAMMSRLLTYIRQSSHWLGQREREGEGIALVTRVIAKLLAVSNIRPHVFPSKMHGQP